MKRVSVIVPCHNSSRYVGRCLEHLVNQTIGINNIELILVDDASCDDGATVDILMEYESKFQENIMVVRLGENVRQGGARNAGLCYASGEYIAFCDSDDWLCDTALEILYDIAKEYDADVVEFDLKNLFSIEEIVEEEKKRVERPAITRFVQINSIEDRRKNIFREDSSLGHCSKLYRGDMIRNNNVRFPEGVAFEEPGFTIPVRFLEEKYVRIHEPLYNVFVHDGSTIQSDYEPKKFDNAMTHDFLYTQLCRLGLLDEYKTEINYLFWYWFFLNTVLFAVHRGCFFTEKELEKLQKRLREVVPSIEGNPYFDRYWGVLPELAKITYCNIHEAGVDTLRNLYTKVNEIC